jgi:predicted ribosome quality control (RQC) complex YloA/Tae2 family protein
MSIDEKTLLEERKVLETDFNTTKDRIVQVEKDLGNMKSNLNAVYGAIQQIDKLLVKIKGDDKKEMPPEKEKALNIATS